MPRMIASISSMSLPVSLDGNYSGRFRNQQRRQLHHRITLANTSYERLCALSSENYGWCDIGYYSNQFCTKELVPASRILSKSNRAGSLAKTTHRFGSCNGCSISGLPLSAFAMIRMMMKFKPGEPEEDQVGKARAKHDCYLPGSPKGYRN